jgi:hypothetical protein
MITSISQEMANKVYLYAMQGIEKKVFFILELLIALFCQSRVNQIQ